MKNNGRKILFVTPPYHCGVVEVAGTWPPLTFVPLAAQAELAGWQAEIYDAMSLRHDHDQIAEFLENKDFDVLAVTAITPTFPDGLEVCQTAKRVNPGCTTLMGGVHPSFMADQILQDEDAVDYIIAGEAELPLYAFLKDFGDLEIRHATPNLLRCGDFGPIRNPSLPLMDNFDDLPMAWHLLDWDLYTYFPFPGSKLGAISTSRGCNHACTFCSQQKFWEQQWRGRAAASVVAEMKHLHDTYGVDVFLFTDEYPTKDAERWEELVEGIIEADLNSYILMETRVEDIVRDEKILPRYREAGIVHIYVGAEATDQETLDQINKEISVDQTPYAFELIAKHDMISETSFVLGFPEETKESINRTLQLAREFNPDFAHFLAITPWPYAELWDEYQDHIEDRDFRNYNLIEPVVKPIAMSRKEIDFAIIECYGKFYMPKMKDFMLDRSKFRRDYLIRSTKMIMQSSFLVKKFARLGIDPKAAMREVMGR